MPANLLTAMALDAKRRWTRVLVVVLAALVVFVLVASYLASGQG